MKMTIELNFAEDWLDNVASENIEALLYKTIYDIKVYADVQNVSVDGKELWSKEKDA